MENEGSDCCQYQTLKAKLARGRPYIDLGSSGRMILTIGRTYEGCIAVTMKRVAIVRATVRCMGEPAATKARQGRNRASTSWTALPKNCSRRQEKMGR